MGWIRLNPTYLLLEDSNYVYSYNKDGSTVWKKSKGTGEIIRYTFNAVRELTDIKKYANEQSSTPITSARYYYDGLRRRIAKQVNGTLTHYVYSDEDIIQELNEAGTQLAYYTHGPEIDEPISVERNGITYYYIADGMGSIIKLVDAAGNVVNNYVYNSFGNIISKTEGVTNYYTYTGREYDSESSLYYCRMRYYDPIIGRFMDCDPMGFSQGVNFYAYTKNNPVNYKDSFGLWYSAYGLRGHKDLTYEAALAMGWSESYASKMGEETNQVDVAFNDIDNSQNHKWHYYVGTEADSRELIRQKMEDAVGAKYTSLALVYLGQGLHVLQDKWSHYKKGATPVNGYWDMLSHIKAGYDSPTQSPVHWEMAYQQTVQYLQTYELSVKLGRIWPGISSALYDYY